MWSMYSVNVQESWESFLRRCTPLHSLDYLTFNFKNAQNVLEILFHHSINKLIVCLVSLSTTFTFQALHRAPRCFESWPHYGTGTSSEEAFLMQGRWGFILQCDYAKAFGIHQRLTGLATGLVSFSLCQIFSIASGQPLNRLCWYDGAKSHSQSMYFYQESMLQSDTALLL